MTFNLPNKFFHYRSSILMSSVMGAFIALVITLAAPAYGSVNLAPPSLDDPYYFGQLTYHKKLACGTCPLSDTTIEAEQAEAFVQSLETDKRFLELLTAKERSAVGFYVKEFFAPRK